MTRTLYRAALGLGTFWLSAGLLLSGCAPAGSPASAPVTGTTPGPGVPSTPARSPIRISFLVFGDPPELRAFQQLVAEFQAREPGIVVELTHVPGPGEYRKRLAADFAAQAPPDVFLLNYRRYADFARRGVLEPLGPYLARSQVLREADFYPQVLAPFRREGTLVGLPQNASSLVVYYNRNLFDSAQIPYPKRNWTWDDFVETARKLTQDPDRDGVAEQYGLGTEVSLQRLAPFLWQNGADLVDDATHPTRLRLETPEAREAIQWFVDLRMDHRVTPGLVEEQAEDSESRFLHGRTAMFLNSRRGVPTYREIRAFTWDVAPLPRRKRNAGILHADGYFMPAAGRHKEAAWKFIEFALADAGQEVLAESGRTVPSLKRVAESSVFLAPTSAPANSRAFLDTLAHARAVPVHPNWADVEELASQELERAYYGQVGVAAAIAGMIERTQEYLSAR